MNERLKIGLNKLISAHYSAVQTDTRLQYDRPDEPFNDGLLRRSKEFWDKFDAEHKTFKALLDSCVIPHDGYQG